MIDPSLEDKLLSQEKRLQEEIATFERLNNDMDQFLKSLGVTKEQLSTLIQDASQFPKDVFEKLQTKKQELAEKSEQSLLQINDPRATSKARASLKDVQRHWLLVR